MGTEEILRLMNTEDRNETSSKLERW